MLPHLLPEEPSKEISPDSPPCAPDFFPAYLLSCTFHGCLKQCYGQHRPGEGLSVALPPSSATSSPFQSRKGEGGTGTFLHKSGLVGFFCLSEAV